MKTIIFTAAAAKDLDMLSGGDRDRVIDALNSYAITGTGDVKRLSSRTQFRPEDQTTILAIYVGKRDSTTYRRH